jgi:hypothetical protein
MVTWHQSQPLGENAFCILRCREAQKSYVRNKKRIKDMKIRLQKVQRKQGTGRPRTTGTIEISIKTT